MKSLLQSVYVGMASLRGNPLRTFLATLGVVIGVAAVVAILSVGDGVEKLAREQMGSTTALQTVTVSPITERWIDGHRVPRENWPLLEMADLDTLMEQLPEDSRALLLLEGTALFQDHEGQERALTLTGVATSTSYESDDKIEFVAGRHLTAAESRDDQPLVEITMSLAAAMGAGARPDSLLGMTLSLGRAEFQVVGVRAGDPKSSLGMVAPLAVAELGLRPRPEPRPRRMVIEASSIEAVDQVQAACEGWLATRLGDQWGELAEVLLNRYRVEQMKQAFLIFKLLMGSIAGISLLTGGIGIMNVLLASVLERTREIGVRKAAGARRRDIVVQFLGEAVAITGAGCLLGLVLGLGTAYLVTAVMRMQTEAEVAAAFTWQTGVVALTLALVVGLGFGIYPAVRASRLSPIEAIRHE